jgi:large subunit ribosomal protein L10
MNRDQKAALVEEIAGQIAEAEAVFAVDYRGLSVPAVAELRRKLRDAGASFRIVKNSLTERAAEKAGAEQLKELLEGPTALTLVKGDAALAAKALAETARALQILEFKGGLMDGGTLTADDIRSIARLPAREVLHAQLVGTVASPITGLVRGLNGLIAGIAVQLQQIAEQGLVGGAPSDAGPAEADTSDADSRASEAPATAAPGAADDAPADSAEEAPAEPEASTPIEQEPEPDAAEDAESSEKKE